MVRKTRYCPGSSGRVSILRFVLSLGDSEAFRRQTYRDAAHSQAFNVYYGTVTRMEKYAIRDRTGFFLAGLDGNSDLLSRKGFIEVLALDSPVESNPVIESND